MTALYTHPVQLQIHVTVNGYFYLRASAGEAGIVTSDHLMSVC